MKSTIVFIGGLPGTGKTTLGGKISSKLSLPYFSKDVIKESLFDTIGYSNREWSKKIGNASYKILDNIIEEELKSGHSFIVESNFKPEFDNKKFQDWQNKYNYNSIQIICSTQPKVLLERFLKRAKSGERHPGHDDLNSINEWKNIFTTQKSEPLEIKGKTINLDTTDYTEVNIENIINKISPDLTK